MAPTKWGILGAGMISNDFVNAIYSLDDEDSHQVKISSDSKMVFLKNLTSTCR